MQQPLTIAHRAGNQRLSLSRAIAAGVDWVETDIWWHHGRIVARHEKAVWRLPIIYDKWKLGVTLRRPISLPELCEQLRAGPRLLLDFKGSHSLLPHRVVETLRRFDAIERAAICGQNWRQLDVARSLEPALRVYYSLETERQMAQLGRRAQGRPAISALSVWEGLLTPERVEDLRARGFELVAWTVNTQRRAEQLVRAGVSGIISDRLDVLAALRPSTKASSGPGHGGV